MKLLIDMNLSPLWVQLLADSGFDRIHWLSIGQPGALVTVDPHRHRIRLLPI